jgi:uncharacterized protein (TIGR01777 family)
MIRHTFERKVRLAFPARDVFDWHARPGAVRRLIPPWQNARVVRQTGTIRDGDRTTFRLRVGGLPMTWVAEHRDFIDGVQFRDVQLKGPFKHWSHLHHIQPAGESACFLTDRIEFALRLGTFGAAAGEPMTRNQLERMFDHRHRVMAADLADHAAIARGRLLTVAITGASGFLGSALSALLTTGGHTVRPVVRGKPALPQAIAWSPGAGAIDAAALEGVDAVVHLAGENVFGRWTPHKKRAIRDSRVNGTRLLAQTLAKLQRKPAVLVSASAVGFYGSRGDAFLTEEATKGTGFLADVCAEWEAEAKPAAEAGIRVVHPRIGVVLHPQGGALQMMLPVFRLGLGGVTGDGRNHMPWITRDDVIVGIYRMLFDDTLAGPVNLSAPDPVTGRQLARTLGRVLRRPVMMPVPRFGLHAVFGRELADETVLASQRAQPLKLAKAGHAFRQPTLEPALRELLGR